MKLYIQSLFMMIILMLIYPLCIDYNLSKNGITNKTHKILCPPVDENKGILLVTPLSIPALFLIDFKLLSGGFNTYIGKDNIVHIK